MKFVAVASLASLAYAAPATVEKRQSTLNEFTGGKGGCKSATMVFARGSTEPGNVGFIIGPPLFTEIKKLYPSIAIEGVKYDAGITTNFNLGGADTKGIDNATKLFQQVAEKCPNTIIVGGGYSQGAAVMHRSVEKLPQNLKDRIAAVILYGDTQNKQDRGQIKNFPKEKVKVFCNDADGVCAGALNVNAGHLSYGKSMEPGAKWLVGMIKAAKPPGGGSGDAGAAPASAPASAAPKGFAPKGAAPKGAAPKGTPAAGATDGAGATAPSGAADGAAHAHGG